MSRITTHVLDVVLGGPAAGIAVCLERQEGDGWREVTRGETDQDGRCRNLSLDEASGHYRLTFETGAYLSRLGRSSIYPEIAVTFDCGDEGHYHLPLLLSDNCYTTYRGS